MSVQHRGAFASLSAMEERLSLLMHDALKGQKINPAYEPRLLAIARKAIDQYGADDNAVINSILLGQAALEDIGGCDGYELQS
jgi:hypothetical protein